MIINRTIVLREAKILVMFLIASIFQSFLMCRSCNSLRSYLLVISFTFSMWLLLWHGNSYLTHYLSAKISWIDFPGRRFIAGLVVTILYTFLSVFMLIFLFETFLGFNFGSGYRFTIIISISLTLIISLFLHSREFLAFWRKASLESAKFQRESISAKYETLKSQVNPAFLFHSLNALSDLVYTDEEKAVKYIKHLADVYRYMLDTRDKEIVSLSEELQFLQAYMYLLHARYGIIVDLRIEPNQPHKFLPPLAVHMIIENCLNPATEVPPSLNVVDEGAYVTLRFIGGVTIASNEKCMDIIDKIRKKYSFLSDQPVVVHNSDDAVEIKLPVIQQ